MWMLFLLILSACVSSNIPIRENDSIIINKIQNILKTSSEEEIGETKNDNFSVMNDRVNKVFTKSLPRINRGSCITIKVDDNIKAEFLLKKYSHFYILLKKFDSTGKKTNLFYNIDKNEIFHIEKRFLLGDKIAFQIYATNQKLDYDPTLKEIKKLEKISRKFETIIGFPTMIFETDQGVKENLSYIGLFYQIFKNSFESSKNFYYPLGLNIIKKIIYTDFCSEFRYLKLSSSNKNIKIGANSNNEIELINYEKIIKGNRNYIISEEEVALFNDNTFLFNTDKDYTIEKRANIEILTEKGAENVDYKEIKADESNNLELKFNNINEQDNIKINVFYIAFYDNTNKNKEYFKSSFQISKHSKKTLKMEDICTRLGLTQNKKGWYYIQVKTINKVKIIEDTNDEIFLNEPFYTNLKKAMKRSLSSLEFITDPTYKYNFGFKDILIDIY